MAPVQVLQGETNLTLALLGGPVRGGLGNLREARASISVIDVDGRAVPENLAYGGRIRNLTHHGDAGG